MLYSWRNKNGYLRVWTIPPTFVLFFSISSHGWLPMIYPSSLPPISPYPTSISCSFSVLNSTQIHSLPLTLSPRPAFVLLYAYLPSWRNVDDFFFLFSCFFFNWCEICFRVLGIYLFTFIQHSHWFIRFLSFFFFASYAYAWIRNEKKFFSLWVAYEWFFLGWMRTTRKSSGPFFNHMSRLMIPSQCSNDTFQKRTGITGFER